MQRRLWNEETSLLEDERSALVALSLVPGIGPGRVRALLARSGSARRVFDLPVQALASIPGVGPRTARAIREFEDWDVVRDQFEQAAHAGAALLTPGDELYPRLLDEIYDPPAILWVRGDRQCLGRPAVAVVGTRRATEYGKRVAFDLAAELAASGIVVVSGLAYGIDKAAHRGAIEGGGVTVAVLGSGADVIYPARHARLADEICSAGAIVSEFPLGAKPDAPNFPRRNRIVSGLCLGTIVVEAFETGGALITARLAIEQNREVFAVPSSIYSNAGTGANLLIRNGHARAAMCATDILADLGLQDEEARQEKPEPAAPQLSGIEKQLYDALGSEPVQIDALCLDTGIDTSTALIHLLSLEFKGIVRQLAGKQFFRS